jgi:competence protein ComEC
VTHRWSARRRRIGEAAVAYSRHVGLAAVAVGLAVGPLHPASAALAALVASVASRAIPLVRTRPAAAGIGVLVLVAACAGHLRVTALERTALGPALGATVDGDAVLLTAPRTDAFGGRHAVVRWRGERVLLRFPPWRAVGRIAIGDIVDVRGSLRAPDRTADAADAHATLRATAVTPTGRRRGGVLGFVDAVRRRSETAFSTALPPTEDALLDGMVLGQDDALPDDVRAAFRTAGLSHLVAASGQNIMLLVALAFGVSVALGLGLRTRWLCILALIVVYVPLAGAGAPIQRAGVVGVAMVAATLAGRPASRWYAVLLSLAVTLALDPRSVAAVGWQLSFAAVAGIAIVAVPARERLQRRGVPAALAEAIAVTCAATLATAPILAAHFGRVSLVSVPANVLAAPAVPAVMWVGMVAAAVAQLSAAVGAAIATTAALPLGFLVWLSRAAAAVPGAEVGAVSGMATLTAITAASVAVIRSEPRTAFRPTERRCGVLVTTALAVLGLAVVPRLVSSSSVGPPAPGELRVTALDIGQGDATLLQVAGHAVLVDAGPAGAPLVPELRRAGVARLDALVVSHPQADHDGGAPSVLARLPVGMLLDGRGGDRSPRSLALDPALRQNHARVVAAEAGQELHAGALSVRVLWPPAGPAVPGADPNDRAVVAVASAYGSRALLTADAESPILAPLDLEPVDVLKVSHHGSADPGLPALLERLRPSVALIEVGRHNTYGHPAPATIAALAATVPTVRRTDRDGTVRVDLFHGAVRAVAGE